MMNARQPSAIAVRIAMLQSKIIVVRSRCEAGLSSLCSCRVRASCCSCSAAAFAADDKVTYDDHVAANLRQRCRSCHNRTAKKADLDVTNYSELMQGGSSAPSIEPGDPDGSYLFTLVTRQI